MVTRGQRQQALEALNSYTRQGALSDLDALGRSLTRESARGAVVIIGSLLEDVLLEEIFKRLAMVDEAQQAKLSKTGGVLGDWVRRLNFARALGIVSDFEVERLEAMAAMRNACAHSRQPIDFDTPELLNMMPLLFGTLTGNALVKMKDRAATRMSFFVCASQLWAAIRGETLKDASQRMLLLFRHTVKGRQTSSPQKPRTRLGQ